MPSREEVREVLRPVQDPELHRSIVDLDMVRAIAIEAGGHVAVTFALTLTVLVANFFMDLVYGFIDPRARQNV